WDYFTLLWPVSFGENWYSKVYAGHSLNGMHPFENEGENDADKGHQGIKKGNAQRSLFSHIRKRFT
ncbi:hypothetical protein, partial [Desulfovibrio piger]|uniref:hypothetical protein n=1 Tax=Desulfovibrio piger TaxID=901 RepID=UPI00197EB126